jgi:hypothetical protein
MTRQILASRVILIATRDAEIAIIAQELARIGEEGLRGRVVLHTSGAMDAAVLDAVHERGAMVGSMHPLQSFSGVSVPSLEGKVFTIAEETEAVRVARQIAQSLGGAPVRIAGSTKILYHTAAAMAAGHVLAVEEAAALAPLAWNEPERSPARLVAPDAPGSGEFRNVRVNAPRGWDRFRAEITKWCGRIWARCRNHRRNLPKLTRR